jgi:hypothetical protein
MLHSFPVPCPDELFYSLMARFADRYNYPSHKTVLRETFGPTTVVATVEFPSRLAAFTTQLPAAHPCAKPDLIEKHTLLPWYAPFLPKDRVNRLRRAMLGNGGCGASALVGLQASRVRVPKMLRYCPQCFSEDWNAGLEMYWRRLHQLTGIDTCPIHKVFLEASAVQRLGRVTRHAFVVPGGDLWQNPSRALTKTDEPVLRVARLGEQLLSGSWPTLGLEAVHSNLMGLLAEAGFRTLGGRIRARKLLRALATHYPKEYLVRVNGSGAMRWLERLIHGPRGAQAPIRYLLVLGLLNVGLERLFRPGQGMPPVRSAPICENAVCRCKASLIFVETVLSRDVGGAVDLFRCKACGSVVAKCSVGRERHWVRDRGFLWREKLATMWADPECSLREIAKILGVDPMTVKRHALKNGLKFPRLAERSTTTRGLEDMLKYKPDRVPVLRRSWLSAREKYPTLGVNALRRKVPRLFASIYRADREWLMAHRPRMANRGITATRVDWSERDYQLLPVLGTIALSLRLRGGLSYKITATALFREAGKESWLPKLAKLPECRARLARLIGGKCSESASGEMAHDISGNAASRRYA